MLRQTLISLSFLAVLTGAVAGCTREWVKPRWFRDPNLAIGDRLNEERADSEGTANPAVQPDVEMPLWTEDFPSAMNRAAAEGKLVMALFTGSDWCSWCVRLEQEVFSKPEFQDWASQHCVLLRVDFPRKKILPTAQINQNRQLSERYGDRVAGYPSVLFLDDMGQVVGQLGYVPGGPQAWIRQAESKVALLR